MELKKNKNLILTLINFIRVSLFSSPLGKYCSFFTGTEKKGGKALFLHVFALFFFNIRRVFGHYNVNKIRKSYKLQILNYNNKK